MAKRKPLTPETSPGRWKAFIAAMEGPTGCNFRLKDKKDPNSATWNCAGGTDQSIARKVLKLMKLTPAEIEETLAYCNANGGHCDCEIVFNCSEPVEKRRKINDALSRES
jgi:hypothetical protein